MARTRMRIASWNGDSFIRAMDGQLRQRMEQATALTAADVKQSMQGGGRPHVPSRPGEPPRVDTGGLRRSVNHSVMVQRHRVRGFVNVDHPAARALELGYAPGNLAPRPYLRPALRRMQPTIISILLGKGMTGPGNYLTLSDIRASQAAGLTSRSGLGAMPW